MSWLDHIPILEGLLKWGNRSSLRLKKNWEDIVDKDVRMLRVKNLTQMAETCDESERMMEQ